MPEVVLTVNGRRHAGWLSATASNSLRQLAGTFSLNFSDRWPGQQEKYSITEGSHCVLTLGGQTVVDGWVDKLSPSYDADSHSLSLSGRDLCGDLADCSHIGKRVDFAGEKLPAIARALCEPFGIQVIAEADCGDALPKARYSQGDSVHDFLLKLCRMRGVLPISYGDGKLVLTTTGAKHSGAKLIWGKNIITGKAEFDSTNRHSQYIVKGQGQAPAAFDFSPKDDEDSEERSKQRAEFVSPRGAATDSTVSRYRPLVLLAESGGDPASMQKRADWEAVNRAGHSRALTYTVHGWQSPTGKLWRINQRVTVEDGLLGINGEQLIESVRFRLSEGQGTVTELGLVHPDAYAANPKDDAAGGVKSKWDFGK
jgi:prophage tail gpP-like protein